MFFLNKVAVPIEPWLSNIPIRLIAPTSRALISALITVHLLLKIRPSQPLSFEDITLYVTREYRDAEGRLSGLDRKAFGRGLWQLIKADIPGLQLKVIGYRKHLFVINEGDPSAKRFYELGIKGLTLSDRNVTEIDLCRSQLDGPSLRRLGNKVRAEFGLPAVLHAKQRP